MRKPTKEQQRALHNLYARSKPQDQLGPGHYRDWSYLKFRRSAFWEFGGTALMVRWCGMLIGIEPDGYTHS